MLRGALSDFADYGDNVNHTMFMHMAEAAADKSKCEDRQVGAVIVLPSGESFAACNVVKRGTPYHAETQAIRSIVRCPEFLSPKDWRGSIVYVTCRPCARCTESLLSFGVKAVYYRDAQPEMAHMQKFIDAGVLVDGRWVMGQVQDAWANRNM